MVLRSRPICRELRRTETDSMPIEVRLAILSSPKGCTIFWARTFAIRRLEKRSDLRYCPRKDAPWLRPEIRICSFRYGSLLQIYSSVGVSCDLIGGGAGVRQDGGSDAVIGLGAESSGLEIPTRRNTFPMTRTTGRIFTSKSRRLLSTLRYF